MKPTKYSVTMDYNDPDKKAFIASNGKPDYTDGLSCTWYFDSEEELNIALGNPIEYKISLNDYVLYASTTAILDSLLASDEFLSRFPNSFGLLKGRKVYLLLSNKDKLPSDVAFANLEVINRNKKKTIVKSSSIIWRGKNIPKNIIFEENIKMKQVIIEKETKISGTEIVLEKNDKIFYKEETGDYNLDRTLANDGWNDDGDGFYWHKYGFGLYIEGDYVEISTGDDYSKTVWKGTLDKFKKDYSMTPAGLWMGSKKLKAR